MIIAHYIPHPYKCGGSQECPLTPEQAVPFLVEALRRGEKLIEGKPLNCLHTVGVKTQTGLLVIHDDEAEAETK